MFWHVLSSYWLTPHVFRFGLSDRPVATLAVWVRPLKSVPLCFCPSGLNSWRKIGGFCNSMPWHGAIVAFYETNQYKFNIIYIYICWCTFKELFFCIVSQKLPWVLDRQGDRVSGFLHSARSCWGQDHADQPSAWVLRECDDSPQPCCHCELSVTHCLPVEKTMSGMWLQTAFAEVRNNNSSRFGKWRSSEMSFLLTLGCHEPAFRWFFGALPHRRGYIHYIHYTNPSAWWAATLE